MDEFLDDSYGGLGYYQQIMDLYQEIEQEIDELREHEYEAADAEARYRGLVSARTANERMKGTPVTIIDNMVRGEDMVSLAKVQWQKAEADAKSSSHMIFLKKDKLEMLTELIKHEWYRPSNG